jgi:hypothetical protein
MTSRFVTARLGPNDVQSGHKDVYWFWANALRPVDAAFVLICTRVLVEGVTSTSREGGALGLWCVGFERWLLCALMS